MGKRDRWDSSSESESESESNNNNTKDETSAGTASIATAKKKQSNSSTNDRNNNTAAISSLLLPLHNPLLQGCRSVYDTYEQIRHISEGTYGVVWQARDLATNEIVALKQIKFPDDLTKEGFPITALRECSVLLAMSHENVVTVREMVVGDSFDKVFMVMEFMEFDLKQGMDRYNPREALAQSELKDILRQILAGMQHMHSKWLLHRDIKTSNILVHRSGRVCLCDFGLARRYQDPPQELTLLVVTLWYRAPELLFGETRYGPAIDMWSIGCMFGELICRDAIMQGQGELDQVDQIFQMVGVPTKENWPLFEQLPTAHMFRWRKNKDDQPDIYKKFPINAPVSSSQAFLDSNGFDLLKKLLTLDPQHRISADDALRHPYFHQGVKPRTPRFFVE